MSTISWRETIEGSALTEIEQATVEGMLSRSSQEAADLQQKVANYGSNHSNQHQRAAFVRGLFNMLTPTSAQGSQSSDPGTGTAFPVTLVSVQVWNIDRNTAEEIRPVLIRSSAWKDLEKEVRAVFKDKWTGPAGDLFTLYYINDLLEPHASRIKVNSDDTVLGYLEFWRTQQRYGKMLFLHIPIIMQADGKPVSPTKPPFSIDTHLARQSASSAVAASSSSHLSPPAGDSPLSPGSPREKEQQLILARDSRPFTPLTTPGSKSMAVYCCVFCGESFIPKLVEAAHLVPISVLERLGKEVEELPLVQLGGVHSVRNGVTACATCHTLFDDGSLWAVVDAPSPSAASSASPAPSAADFEIRLSIDDSVRSDDHASRLHGRIVQQPSDARLRPEFPPLRWWQWRMEWAVLKRADVLARDLAKLQVSGTCACGKDWNSKCKNKDPSARKPLCLQCCVQSQQSGKGVPCRVHHRAKK